MQQELIQKEEEYTNLEVCGGNFITPVIDKATYLDEIRYTIGQITYTENAD
jgi:hypothetical protein